MFNIEKLKIIADNLTTDGRSLSIPASSVLTSRINGSEKIASSIAETLGRELWYIKGKVIPAIKEYATIVKNKIEAGKEPSILSKYNIAIMEIPEFISLGYERNLYTKLTNVTLPRGGVLRIPTVPPTVIRTQYLKSDIPSISNAISTYAAVFTDQFLASVWEKYIENISIDNSAFGMLGREVANGIPGSELFALTILLPNIKSNPPEGARARSVDIFDMYINAVTTLVYSKLDAFVERYNMYERREILVSTMSNYETVALVPRTMYTKFINEGGSPEVIYGHLIANGPKTATYSYSDVVDNADNNIKTWENEVKKERIVAKQNEKHRYKMAYVLCMDEMFSNYFDAATISELGFIKDTYNTHITSLTNNVTDETLFDIPGFAERAIGTLVFAHTNTYRFLQYMRDAAALDHNITPNEAASYASLQLIIDYLLTQVTVEGA